MASKGTLLVAMFMAALVLVVSHAAARDLAESSKTVTEHAGVIPDAQSGHHPGGTFDERKQWGGRGDWDRDRGDWDRGRGDWDRGRGDWDRDRDRGWGRGGDRGDWDRGRGGYRGGWGDGF